MLICVIFFYNMKKYPTGLGTVFGVEPRVAMLSYSTGSSGTGVDVEKAPLQPKDSTPLAAVEDCLL
ncbi:MAG: phosphate acyltransferase [Desulfobacterium sp.]